MASERKHYLTEKMLKWNYSRPIPAAVLSMPGPEDEDALGNGELLIDFEVVASRP